MGLVTLTFDRLILKLVCVMRVASKVGNLPFKFGHTRPLCSRIIRYVRDGRTDGQNQRLLPLPFRGGGITTIPCQSSYLLFGQLSDDS